MRNLVFVVVLAVMMLCGAWLVAKYDLSDRAYQFEQSLGEIGAERGGNAPTVGQVKQKIEEKAKQAGVEVTDVKVTVESLSAANMARADGATRAVQGKLDQINAAGRGNPAGVQSESSGLTNDLMQDRQLVIRGTVIEISLQMHAEKWLWSEDAPVTTSITIR